VFVSVSSGRTDGTRKSMKQAMAADPKEAADKRRLFRVKFHDQLFPDFLWYLLPFRVSKEDAFAFVRIVFQPREFPHIGLLSDLGLDEFEVLGLSPELDDISRPQLKGRNIGKNTIDHDMAMAYHLSCGSSGGSQAQPEHGVVQPGFQELQEDSTCHAMFVTSLFKKVSELTFQYTVGVFSLLFLHQLDGVVGTLFAPTGVPMLSGWILLFIESFAEAVNGLTERTGFFLFRTFVPCHYVK